MSKIIKNLITLQFTMINKEKERQKIQKENKWKIGEKAEIERKSEGEKEKYKHKNLFMQYQKEKLKKKIKKSSDLYSS